MVAAVAVGFIANWAALSLLNVPQVSVAAQYVVNLTTPLTQFVTGIGSWLSGFLPHIPSMISTFFSHTFGIHAATDGATAAVGLSAASKIGIAGSIQKSASTVAAIGGGAIATTQLVPGAETHGVMGHEAATEMMTTSIKTSHVAAENSEEHRTSERVAALRSAQTSQSWVDRTGGARSTAGGFAEQLNADRAHLDAALAEPTR